MRRFLSFPIAVVVLAASSAHAAPVLTPPVDAVIERPFDGPDSHWGPGHRGIDYAIPSGAWVRSAAAGTVSFAGRVPGGFAVTVDHGLELETTYSILSEVMVEEGDVVGEGGWLGRSMHAHPGGGDALHFGVKLGGHYVDPMLHLGPLDATRALALAPLEEAPDAPSCNPSDLLPEDELPPPNDHVAVVVGGITSSTASPPDLFGTVSRLGYPEERVFRFSYRSANGPDLHEPYSSTDTYGDLRDVAARLRTLLARIAARYPGVPVDLLAHSQGGIVARTYLAEQARTWDEGLPRVAHLVTFASPHQGVPAAGEIDEIESGPIVARGFSKALGELSDRGLPIPSFDAEAVAQMTPGSRLLGSLARQDVAFGTKVLALSIPNDLIVPQGRAEYPGKPSVVVPSEGWFGHSSIARSPRALQVARAFLAGAGAACPPHLGPLERHFGTVVDAGQSLLGELVNGVARRIFPL